MAVSGIQGQQLEIKVVGCIRLKDTEWISRQDPYVCIEYGSWKCRTGTCTDGGTNPVFQEKFRLTLIEGLRELNIGVWNSNTIRSDDFIGSGKLQLQNVLSQGFDEASCTLLDKNGRFSGEAQLMLHYPNANRSAACNSYSAPTMAPSPRTTTPYPFSYSASIGYPPTPPSTYPSPYPPSSYSQAAYPQSPYPPTKFQAACPPSPYPPTKFQAASPPSPYPPTTFQAAYPPGPPQPFPTTQTIYPPPLFFTRHTLRLRLHI